MIKVNGVKINPERYRDNTYKLNINIYINDLYYIDIEWLYEQNEEFLLYLIVNHIKDKYPNIALDLYMPYVPNARMDRTKYPHEVFTLKYFAKFINDLKFNFVYIKDVHSNISLALLNNVVEDDITYIINHLKKMLLTNNNDLIVYPDEGASKRYAEYINFPYIYCIKNKDWITGQIKEITLSNTSSNPASFNALIVDDIISTGSTTLLVIEKLKQVGANKIWIYATHVENSILDSELLRSGLIERIYTTRSIFTKEHNLIEIIE